MLDCKIASCEALNIGPELSCCLTIISDPAFWIAESYFLIVFTLDYSSLRLGTYFGETPLDSEPYGV